MSGVGKSASSPRPLDERAFAGLLAALPLPPADQPLAIAVSGGADSMALCLLLGQWTKKRRIPLTALIFDHGIRAESAKEAATVKRWLVARKIPAIILKPSKKLTAPNLQAKAREARYDAFAAWCRKHETEYLFTAHHADDQLETLLMRFVRGGGVEGLAGIPPVSRWQELVLLRPLLSIEKESLTAYLTRKRHPWIEDPSNHSAAYTRNRLRKVTEVLKEEGLTGERLATTTRLLRQAGAALETQAHEILRREITLHPAGYAEIPATLFQTLSPEIGYRTLRRLAMLLTGQPLDRAETLVPLLEALQQGPLPAARTLCGLLFSPQPGKDRLLVVRELKRLPEDISIKKGKSIVWDYRFAVRSAKPLPGMSIGALLPEGVAALPSLWRKKLTDSGIPKTVLHTFPAVRGVEGLLFVPHIGYQVETWRPEMLEIEFLPLKTLAGPMPGCITADGMVN